MEGEEKQDDELELGVGGGGLLDESGEDGVDMGESMDDTCSI